MCDKLRTVVIYSCVITRVNFVSIVDLFLICLTRSRFWERPRDFEDFPKFQILGNN